MTFLRVAAYEPARRHELFRLMEEVWGASMGEDEFEWWFERNPAGPPLISLAENGDRLAGVACMSPYRLQVDGEGLTSYVPLHVATHPDYRGRGIFTLLERANEADAVERCPIAITFPNEASRRVFVSRLDWIDLPSPRVWARPAVRRGLPRGVEIVHSFGQEADALWRRLAPRYGNALVRDSTYLNWRYAESPRSYVCLAAADGVAVVGRKNVGRLQVAYVADLIAEPGRPARRLLRGALAVARAPALLALPPLGGAGDLLHVGFTPTPKRILVLGKRLRDEAHLPTDWRFSLGDGDSY